FDVTAVENNDFVVFRLNEVIPGRMNEIAPRERQNRRRQLSDQHGNESITAYLGEMRANADVVVKDERSLSEIGRASCRERVQLAAGGGTSKKHKPKQQK